MVLTIGALLPLVSPARWRRVFEEALRLQDGQIRFIGLASVLVGLLTLALLD